MEATFNHTFFTVGKNMYDIKEIFASIFYLITVRDDDKCCISQSSITVAPSSKEPNLDVSWRSLYAQALSETVAILHTRQHTFSCLFKTCTIWRTKVGRCSSGAIFKASRLLLPLTLSPSPCGLASGWVCSLQPARESAATDFPIKPRLGLIRRTISTDHTTSKAIM